jgi:hypothetical protein
MHLRVFGAERDGASPTSSIDLVRASSVDDTFWLIVTNASTVHLYSGVQDIDRGMAEEV